MKLRILTAAVWLSTASACAFFDQPLEDFGTLPPPDSKLPAPAPPLPSSDTQSTAEPQALTATQPVAQASNTTGTYFTVATLFDIPDNTPNISFVHFTKSGGSSDETRALGICKALLKNYDPTAATDVPANAKHLIVWPVENEYASPNCTEMLDNYDPVEIGDATAAKIKSDAIGPFLLSRNSASDKRMVFDFSEVRARGLAGALKDWKAIVGGAEADWPDYTAVR